MPTLTASGQAGTTGHPGSITISAFDCTGGNVLVAFVGIRSNASQAVAGVLYGTTPMVQHSLTAGTFGRLYTFKLVDPPAGAANLVASFSADDDSVMVARAVSGAHATDPCRAHNETIDVTLTADAISVSSSTAQAGDLCLDCCQVITGTNPTMTADAGQENAITQAADASLKMAASTEAMPGGVTMGWSGWTNLRCRTVIVPIAPAAGAGGTGGSGMMLMGVG